MTEMNQRMVSEVNATEAQLSRLEQKLQTMETKVRETDFNLSSTDFCNSTAVEPEISKFSQNEISRIVQNEIEKLNKSDGTTVIVSQELRDTIRVELTTKEANIRRDYKLTTQTKYEYFLDFLKFELRMSDLLYVIEPSIETTVNLNTTLSNRHKFKVRDIIINRIDPIYHARVVEIEDPIKLLERIKEIKISETNVTSTALCRQLYNTQYINQIKRKRVFL